MTKAGGTTCQQCKHRVYQACETRGFCAVKQKFVQRKDPVCAGFKLRKVNRRKPKKG